MAFYDYHVHSCFSEDSNAPMVDMVQAGIEKGLAEMCFCDHVDFGYTDPGFAFLCDVEKQQEEIAFCQQKYDGQITIKKGLEIGLQPHVLQQYEDFLPQYEFDFILASMHTCQQKDIHTGAYFAGKTAKDAYCDYFDSFLTCLKQFKNYNCLGHLDILKRYGNHIKEPDYEVYQEGLEAVLKQVIVDGKGIEVNTSGFRHGKGAPYPSYAILKRYKELGGEMITTGSDAHTPQDLAIHFSQTYAALKEIGFCYVCTFLNRKPYMQKI